MLPPLPLPPGVRSRQVDSVNGLTVHLLEAGEAGRPCLLLLHGFPELALSWRLVMPALADAGYHVIAPDLRGFGRTTGWDGRYDGDVAQFRTLNMVIDALALLKALGIREVAAVIGHDLGSQIAAYAGLTRPDVFRAVVMMSAPWPGPPPLQLNPGGAAAFDKALGALTPPRKHYTHYYSGPDAAADMDHPPQGLHDFLRAYFHAKSGDDPANAPRPLPVGSVEAFADLPTYYLMRRELGMAATVAPDMPTKAQIAACHWLPDDILAVYAAEYARAGFQGGLQSYRCRTDAAHVAELRLHAGAVLTIPAAFIAGERDWGIHQTPGALDPMRPRACAHMSAFHLVPGAGHWVQQEAAEAVTGRLLDFLSALNTGTG